MSYPTRSFLPLVLLVLFCVSIQSVHAAVVHDVYLRVNGQDGLDSMGVEQTIGLTPGTTYLSQLILRETVSNADPPVLGTSLGLSGVAISIGISPGSSTIDGEMSPFGLGDQSGPGVVRGLAFPTASPVTTISPTVFESVAGQFNLNFANDSSVTITLADLGPGQDFGVIAAGNPTLDNTLTFRSTTFTAIPEPGVSTVMLMGVAACVLRRRKRR